MSLLLDTHYVFAIAGSPGRLTGPELNFLAAYSDPFVVSAVSIWEMWLKWDALHASGDRKGRAEADHLGDGGAGPGSRG